MEITGLKKEYLEDLNIFLDYADAWRGIENDKDFPEESFHLNFYLNHSKDELNAFINEYLNQNAINNAYDFYYMLNCIIKYMSGVSDAHTIVKKKDNIWFPIRFKVINNNVYIDRCFDKKYLRKKIIKVNNVDINKVIAQIEKCTSYGTKGWLEINIEDKLTSKNDLLSLPCISGKTKKIIFETEDNELLSFDINKNYNEQTLYPKKDKEQYKIIDNMLIFKYPLCKETYRPDINKIKEILNNNSIDKFVLDLRDNTGGNSIIIKELIEFLSNSNLELFTLVDKGVFSSGRFALIDMKRIGSKIIGEEIGTPINCFGYVSGNGITPNSKINFHFAKVYWYEENGYMKGIYTKEDLIKQSKEFFKPKYVQIDYPIEILEKEYINIEDDIFLKKSIETINLFNNKKL